MRILMAHGSSGPVLYDVVCATMVARLLYAAQLGGGLQGNKKRTAEASEGGGLQSAMRRLIHLRFLPEDSPTVEHLCHAADSRLFSAVLGNPGMYSMSYYPQKDASLCPRLPDRFIPQADNLTRRWFIIRMLYSV